MKARCMKLVDLGDGVTMICGFEFGHDGRHGITAPQMGERCDHRGDSYPRECLRAKDHGGPHKFGNEGAA